MKTYLKHLFVAASLACMVAGGGLVGTAQARDYYERGYRDDCRRCGTVRSIERVGRRDGSGGAVVGALIGGALGNQIGSGDGRKAATVAGAIAGGVAGHNMQRNRGGGYRIVVRMDNGRIRDFYQGSRQGLRPGDRVEINRGDVYPLY